MDAHSSRRRTNIPPPPPPPPLHPPDSLGREENEHHESENLHNVLQKHVAFFDRNKDGLVYPWETFQGFRAIGCGWWLSCISALFINLALSHKTRPGKWPSLLFPIEVKNIQRGKHGSDSGVYDANGRFLAEKFEEIFKRHAKTNADALTLDELMSMLKSNRQPRDYGGWFASWTEWKLLYVLCNDKKGLLQKETIRGVYDGSLFEHMQRERQLTPSKD